MKAVKFLMPYTHGTLYRTDEKATFEKAVADDLIKREIAEEVPMKKQSAKGDAKE